jgi:hypothetical protein
MRLLSDCRICKKKMEHLWITEFDVGVETYVLQCLGCGVKGVMAGEDVTRADL